MQSFCLCGWESYPYSKISAKWSLLLKPLLLPLSLGVSLFMELSEQLSCLSLKAFHTFCPLFTASYIKTSFSLDFSTVWKNVLRSFVSLMTGPHHLILYGLCSLPKYFKRMVRKLTFWKARWFVQVMWLTATLSHVKATSGTQVSWLLMQSSVSDVTLDLSTWLNTWPQQ